MKKIVSHIIICLLVAAIQLVVEVIPFTRYPLQLKICATSIEEIFEHEKLKVYVHKMNQVEKDQLITFKKVICNQQ